jgi:hypothetical protein
LPKRNPCFIEVPAIRFAVINGEGNPNEEAFQTATAALYSFSYAVKVSYKSKEIPEGFYDYTVFPLERLWDLADDKKSTSDKNNFAYSIMIRQPDFLTDELFERFLAETKKKKPNLNLHKLQLQTIREGLCCQMLHLRTYDDEPESFEKMQQFCMENGYQRISKVPREIYLSDPRKTEVSKLKTVLRFQVSQKADN